MYGRLEEADTLIEVLSSDKVISLCIDSHMFVCLFSFFLLINYYMVVLMLLILFTVITLNYWHF